MRLSGGRSPPLSRTTTGYHLTTLRVEHPARQVVGVGVGEGFAGGAGGFGFVLAAQRFEAEFQDAAEGLFDDDRSLRP